MSDPGYDSSDAAVVRAELRALHDSIPVVFGGAVAQDQLRITGLFGTRTAGLRDLVVPTQLGLGGRVIDNQQPVFVEDYRRCDSITHHFDRPVLAEGISSILAVPVVVAGRSRAVLYGAVRGRLSLGTRALGVVTRAAQRIATELTVRDEVEQRLRLVAPVPEAADGGATEVLREIHAQLRTIAAATTDAATQQQLRALCSDIAGGRSTGVKPQLSRRELDVLAYVALGYTNADIAQHLGVRTETAKSYLRSSAAKLGAHSRVEAVVIARRHGLLP